MLKTVTGMLSHGTRIAFWINQNNLGWPPGTNVPLVMKITDLSNEPHNLL